VQRSPSVAVSSVGFSVVGEEELDDFHLDGLFSTCQVERRLSLFVLGVDQPRVINQLELFAQIVVKNVLRRRQGKPSLLGGKGKVLGGR